MECVLCFLPLASTPETPCSPPVLLPSAEGQLVDGVEGEPTQGAAGATATASATAAATASPSSTATAAAAPTSSSSSAAAAGVGSTSRSDVATGGGGGGGGGDAKPRGGDPLDDVGWVREELHRWMYDNVRAKCESGGRAAGREV